MIDLHEVSLIDAPVDRCFHLTCSVEVRLLDNVHCGEPAIALAGQTTGLVGMGQQVTWRARHLALQQTFTTRVTRFDPPVFLQDTVLHGAFRSMQHDYHFRELTGDRTEVTDVLRVSAQLPVLGRIAELLILRRYMRMLLLERSAVVKQLAESTEWKRYLPHI